MRALLVSLAFVGMATFLVAQDAQLSETEQLRLDLHKTQIAYEQALADAGACRAQLRGAQLTLEQQQLRATIEKAHPGYSLDVSTGALKKVP